MRDLRISWFFEDNKHFFTKVGILVQLPNVVHNFAYRLEFFLRNTIKLSRAVYYIGRSFLLSRRSMEDDLHLNVIDLSRSRRHDRHQGIYQQREIPR